MCSLSERAVLTPSGAPTDIFVVLHITNYGPKAVSSFISVWSKDLCCLAGTPGTWWMKGMESSTSWFCAGAKATAGETLQQHHCQRYTGVRILSYFHFVQSSPRLRHRLKPMTPPTAPFPAYFSHRRSLIPVLFSGNDYVKITRSRVWGSHYVMAENGLPCRLSEYSAAQLGWNLLRGEKTLSSLWNGSQECGTAFGHRVTKVDH